MSIADVLSRVVPPAPHELTPLAARRAPRRVRIPRPPRPVRPPWPQHSSPASTLFVLAALSVTLLSVWLRAFHQSSAYELFVDEIQYADVGNSFAAGIGPQLFGAPFYLHPPLFFAVLGAVIGAPVDHMSVEFVLGLRPVVLVFATANTLLIIALARRVVGPWAALLTGLFYALDPFVIRFDSRLMLEAPMMTWVLAGVLLMLLALERPTVRSGQIFLGLGGIAFGLAICTKSTSVFVTAVPLVLMIATSWGLGRVRALKVLVVQGSVYLLYLAWVVVTGHLADWFEGTLAGSLRAVGLIKETGYSSANVPSLGSRVAAQLGLFAPSYLLIGVGASYACYLLWISWRELPLDRRFGRRAAPSDGRLGLLTCWLAGVLVGIVYTVGLGEVEEQSFYLLAVPSTVVVGLLAVHAGAWRRRGPAVALAVLAAATLAGSSLIWSTLHTQRDDTYAQLVAWIYPNVDTQNEVVLGESTAQFVLPGYGLHALTSIDQTRRYGAQYALVSTQLTSLGLAQADQRLLDRLAERYTPVFVAHGRSTGDLVLYDLFRPRPGFPAAGPLQPTPVSTDLPR